MTQQSQTSVLITGANKGLGLEAARRLGALGWKVFLGSRDEARGRDAVAKLHADGADAVLVPLDVTSDESVAAAFALVREHTATLDVLINNAGAPGHFVAPELATADELHGVYDTNVYGPVRVTHAFLPLLQAAANPRVIMVSSGGGSFAVITDPTQPVASMHELAYSSSKAALNMITVRYAQALPGIKFNVVTPGEVANRKFAATDMNGHRGQLTVTEGTDPFIALATAGPDGPTATFTDRLGPVAWLSVQNESRGEHSLPAAFPYGCQLTLAASSSPVSESSRSISSNSSSAANQALAALDRSSRSAAVGKDPHTTSIAAALTKNGASSGNVAK
ncbi:NAD(P)-dependent dehydrogenase (short-subunit alcohol dehydrogenase family) [Glycomyces algeriensis]|nr:SDR family NAD(P)-dependent oxidoreductase [Glycomyces algeriensis]MDA1368881.1 SDR family NAD(P)-dependent oxidoreductase [Glycomyces algeriensis]MDR7352846.1 NAD(P)-dependent dehydrogenase (short-subunit alcohol dehydrogenase family) [Glycomyces algeriensis]